MLWLWGVRREGWGRVRLLVSFRFFWGRLGEVWGSLFYLLLLLLVLLFNRGCVLFSFFL